MTKIYDIENFSYVGKHKKKRQILLTHTSRNIKDYIMSLKHRYNGNNKKLPHYIVDREGNIYNIIPPNTYSEYMDVGSHNKRTIIITLENLGWLRKNPLKNNFINWIGEEYKDEVHKRKWRGHYFWQPYTESQIDSAISLINDLCEEFDIPFNSIGHNVKVDKVENFNGIVTHSNYDSECTDLNPAFDFNIFINKNKDE